MQLAEGAHLGPYQILALAGRGGMGEVYRAMDSRLNRIVAIKILPSHFAGNAEMRQRFDREAKAISSLNHPNICTLHDVGHQDGVEFLVMEFLEGETLSGRLKKGPLPMSDCLTYGAQIADALDAAHRRGILHRDLKPGNIILTKSGAKLLDFGLAKQNMAGGSFWTNDETRTTPISQQGAIVGTLQYMSPEQLEGKELDSRSDIFSFGAVLYEMISGKRAFEATGEGSPVASILRKELPLLSEQSSLIPPAAARLVSRCLAKNPDNRWQSARDIALELVSLDQQHSEMAAGPFTPSSARFRVWVFWALTAALIVVAGILAMKIAWPDSATEKSYRFLLRPGDRNFDEWGPRISPDGTMLAYYAASQTSTDLLAMIRSLHSATPRLVATNPKGDTRFFWSPDSRYLASFGDDYLSIMDMDGNQNQVRIEAKVSAGSDASWGSRGFILFDGDDSIRKVSEKGGLATVVVAPDKRAGEVAVGFPSFMPDGHRFLYTASIISNTAGSISHNVLKFGDLDSESEFTLFQCDNRVLYDPTGYLLYSKDTVLFARKFDPDNPEDFGEPISLGSRPLFGDFNISGTGILVYYYSDEPPNRRSKSVICKVSRRGKLLNNITEIGYVNGLRLSHDGQRVAFVKSGASGSTQHVWIQDIDRGVATPLDLDQDSKENPVWSPDDAKIICSNDSRRGTRLTEFSTDGSGASRLVYESNGFYLRPCFWNPDGGSVYCVAVRPYSGDYDILSLNLGEQATVDTIVASKSRERLPVPSPDGRLLAYVSDETGDDQVHLMSLDGSNRKWRVSTQSANSPLWSEDGRTLYYCLSLGVDSLTRIMSVAVNRTTEVSLGKPVFVCDFSVSEQFDWVGEGWKYDLLPRGDGFLVLHDIETLKQGAPESAGFVLVINWTAELADER